MGSRACMLVALAGCGRLGFDPATSEPPATAPAVCAPHEWTNLALDVALDVAATATPDGVAITWTKTAGSAVSGALLDHSMQLSLIDPVKTGGYVTTSISYVDGMLVSAEVESGLTGIKYDTARSDLRNAAEFACPTASHAPNPAVLHAGADVIAVSGFDNGLTVWPIVGWSQQASIFGVVTTPVTAMAASEVGPVAAIAWSTADACHVELVTDAGHGTGTSMNAPCRAPELASDGTSALLAYETPTGIAIARGDATALDPSTIASTIPAATSPRVVYDGTRYWIGYLDPTGAVMVGTLSDTLELATTAVGHVPQHDAFDLAVLDGQIWAVAVDAEGLAADRICLR